MIIAELMKDKRKSKESQKKKNCPRREMDDN
jgi:hypothetical protein